MKKLILTVELSAEGKRRKFMLRRASENQYTVSTRTETARKVEEKIYIHFGAGSEFEAVEKFMDEIKSQGQTITL